MGFGILHVAHQHGPAAVVTVFATYKYAKYKIFCWRRDVLNQKVRSITGEKFSPQLDEGEQHQEDVGCCPLDAVCAVCRCPLWLHEEEEYTVQLSSCGCFVHSKCLMETATRQHGIGLPDGLWNINLNHCLVNLRRLVGVDAIVVEEIRCPCGQSSSSWRRVIDKGEFVTSLVSAASVPETLRRGSALSLESFRRALLHYGGAAAPEFKRWRDAANSDKTLITLLQQEGGDASSELSTLFGPKKLPDYLNGVNRRALANKRPVDVTNRIDVQMTRSSRPIDDMGGTGGSSDRNEETLPEAHSKEDVPKEIKEVSEAVIREYAAFIFAL